MTATQAGLALADLFGADARADPYPVYQRIHAFGPVVELPVGTMVVGHAEAITVLRDPRLVVEDADRLDRVVPGWRAHPSRRLLADTVLYSNQRTHERMRDLSHRVFSARQVDAQAPAISARTAALLDDLGAAGAGGSSVDFIPAFAAALPLAIVCDLFGIPEAERYALPAPLTALAGTLEAGWPTIDLAAADRAAVELHDYMCSLVRRRRVYPGSDLVSTVLQASESESEPLPDAQVVANLVLLLLAGFETMVGLLGNAVDLLLDRPQMADVLRRSPDRVPMFVEEVLRFDPPVQLTVRHAAMDLDVSGVPIACGTSVFVALGAANRDPRVFAEPDVFDPIPRKVPALGFGSGAHYCLGARLARSQARQALVKLIERFPRLARAGTPIRLDRFALRAYRSLPITLS